LAANERRRRRAGGRWEKMRLDGKAAVVVGGGSGIGAATVRLFAQEGARVVVADRDLDAATEVADGLQGVHAAALDVTESSQVNEVIGRAERTFGRLDILVNSAGVMTVTQGAFDRMHDAMVRVIDAERRGEHLSHRYGFMEAITDEEWAGVLQINLTGTFYCVRAAVAPMTRAGGGSIVNVSSVSALMGDPMPAYYPASKAGVLGLTRVAAGELAERNIRVNAVAPGATDTPLFRSNPAPLREALVRLAPLARAADPVEIAASILYLASDESAYVTGQTISPNGGMWM
jgi:NAD(P)-dependent dehydrogenase (short-subunit alcohol dehydrogenase family)